MPSKARTSAWHITSTSILLPPWGVFTRATWITLDALWVTRVISLSFTRTAGQKPPVIAKLHLNEWLVQHKTVEFALKDIPLP